MQTKTREEVINEALGEFLQVMMWRRDLHQHPELSFQEWRTSKFIAEALHHDGIEYRPIADTGILAKIHGTANIEGREKKAIVLRADVDALPINESTGVEFESLNNGVMHACGHDMHTAILLGALRILNRHRDQFAGTVFGLFQPGEELNPGGAVKVMEENPFADYDIIAFVGEHVEPLMQTGTFGFRKGKYMASSDELRFTVRGKGGHAAMRDRVKDPVLAAARIIDTLHAVGMEHSGKVRPAVENKSAAEESAIKGRPAIAKRSAASGLSIKGQPAIGERSVDNRQSALEEQPTIISIGRVIAEGATNIVPDEVYMEGTMRTFDERWRKKLKEIIRSEVAKIDSDLGVATEVDISEGYPSVYNDRRLTGRVMTATRELFGGDSVAELGLRPTSEDFGYYTRKYPSVYYRLGVGGHGEFFEKHEAGRIHTSTFRPDEKALGYGVVQFVNIVLAILGE